MNWGRIIPIVLGLVCVVGAGWFIVDERRQIADASDWPSVEGRIVESWVDVETRRRNNTRLSVYIPRVQYEYQVGGQSYRNHYIWLTSTETFSSRASADEVRSRYRVGGSVPVFYDPDDPGRSALIIESKSRPMFVVVALGLFLIGLGLWLGRRPRRQASSAANVIT